MTDITQEIQMFFYFGYVLPAILIFILNCWDEIVGTDTLTLRAVLRSLGFSIVPLLNLVFFFAISWHLILKYDVLPKFITLDFVIYRRKK
jgi:hypothetical protein